MFDAQVRRSEGKTFHLPPEFKRRLSPSGSDAISKEVCIGGSLL